MTKPWVHQRLMGKKTTEPQGRFLNIQQVVRRLNCSKSQVYKLFESGEIETIRLGPQKGLRALEWSVDEFLAKKIAEAGEGAGAAGGAGA